MIERVGHLHPNLGLKPLLNVNRLISDRETACVPGPTTSPDVAVAEPSDIVGRIDEGVGIDPLVDGLAGIRTYTRHRVGTAAVRIEEPKML